MRATSFFALTYVIRHPHPPLKDHRGRNERLGDDPLRRAAFTDAVRGVQVATEFQHEDELTEAEQRLQRLRRALEDAKRAIRDAEAMLHRAEGKRRPRR